MICISMPFAAKINPNSPTCAKTNETLKDKPKSRRASSKKGTMMTNFTTQISRNAMEICAALLMIKDGRMSIPMHAKKSKMKNSRTGAMTVLTSLKICFGKDASAHPSTKLEVSMDKWAFFADESDDEHERRHRDGQPGLTVGCFDVGQNPGQTKSR